MRSACRSCVPLLLLSAAAARPAICETESRPSELTAHRSGCPAGSSIVRLAGANIFDVWWDTSSGMNTPGNFTDSVRALSDAKNNGIRFFRYFASLFGQSMAFWAQHEDRYWQEYDRLMDAFDQSGLYAIPSIGYSGQWYHTANVVYGVNESANDLVLNMDSKSYQLMEKYTSQFVERYSNRSSILLWELGNELNLMVNLPPPWCGDEQCFNTSAMAAFTAAQVAMIRKADRRRPVSSGFSVGRSTAWHQEHCPSSGACAADPGKNYWSTDTKEQWQSMVTKQQAFVDIWSAHYYANPSDCYFSPSKDPKECVNSASGVIGAIAEAADKAGAALFVGEYGGKGPNFTGPSAADQQFNQDMLDFQVAQKHSNGSFIISSIWAFECPTHRKDMVCIFPGSSAPKEAGSTAMLGRLQKANAALVGSGQ